MINFSTSAARSGVTLRAVAALAVLTALLISALPGHGESFCVGNTTQVGTQRDPADDFNLLFGWPCTMEGESSIWGRCPAVLDFDGNRDFEIGIVNTEGVTHVFQHDGANFPGFPKDPNRPQPMDNPRHNATFACGDLTADNAVDIVYISDLGFLHLLTYDAERNPFPVDLGRDIDCGVPALADVNRNGDLEIVFNSWSIQPDSLEAQAQLNVFNSAGSSIEGWPVMYPRGSSSSPVVGDIDGQEGVEILVGNARHLDQPAQVYAWFEDGRRVPGFPVGNFQTIHSAPTLVDLDGQGGREVILWAADLQGFAGIYAYRGDGSAAQGFPLECPIGHPDGSPIAADITGDNSPEIVFGSYNPNEGGSIFAWRAAGEMLEGFPIQLDRSVIGTVLAADVSGDGISDVVAALSPVEGQAGIIVAYDHRGEMIEGFPIELEAYGGGAFAWTPTLWDVDRDQDIDMIAVTTDRRMLIWGTPGRMTDYTWPTYKGNMRRDGRCVERDPNAVRPEIRVALPKETSLEAWPNPFNASAKVSVSLPHSTGAKLEIIDCAGRVVQTVKSGLFTAGLNEFSIDPSNSRLSSGVYIVRFSSENQSKALRVLYLP